MRWRAFVSAFAAIAALTGSKPVSTQVFAEDFAGGADNELHAFNAAFVKLAGSDDLIADSGAHNVRTPGYGGYAIRGLSVANYTVKCGVVSTFGWGGGGLFARLDADGNGYSLWVNGSNDGGTVVLQRVTDDGATFTDLQSWSSPGNTISGLYLKVSGGSDPDTDPVEIEIGHDGGVIATYTDDDPALSASGDPGLQLYNFTASENRLDDVEVWDDGSGGGGGGSGFGTSGCVPTCSDPATGADGAWTAVDGIDDTLYVPWVDDPVSPTAGGWKQISDLVDADQVPMVDDPTTPTHGAWVAGPLRSCAPTSTGFGPGAHAHAGATVITDYDMSQPVIETWFPLMPDPTLGATTITRDADGAYVSWPAGYVTTGDSVGSINRPIASGERYANYYVRTKIKFSANDENDTSAFINKLLYFFFQANGDNRDIVFTACGDIAAGGAGTADDDFEPGLTPQGLATTYMGGANLVQNQTSGVRIVRGTLHEYEFEFNLNTPGSADGRIRVWMDGTLIMDYTGMEIMSSGQIRAPSQISWQPIKGGTGGQTLTVTQYQNCKQFYIEGWN